MAVINQLKNSGILFFGQLLIKGSSFLKQILLAFFLGISSQIDLLLISQIIPAILMSMIAGGAGEILVTTQKKNKSYDNQFIVLFIFTILVITCFFGLIYLFLSPFVADLFHVSNIDYDLFINLSFVIIICQIPSVFVSTLQHLLFAKEKYKYFVFVSLISEIFGLVFIITSFNIFGIISFPIGLLITQLSKALFFFIGHQLAFISIFDINNWKKYKNELVAILKKTLSLSIQTFLIHFSTFWERILSFRFLSPGFLSALNYSKSLTELPKMAMLSSILTTTYIEQVNRRTTDVDSYIQYSNRMERFLNQVSFIFQILSLIFAPLILILLFKRGAFDETDVRNTFLLYQILSIGFLPGLMMNFLSRTMYIESEYRMLFYFILIKTILEISIMAAFIEVSQYSIPIALVIGKFFSSFCLFVFLNKKNKNMFCVNSFVKLYVVLFVVSIIIVLFNQFILDYILMQNIFKLIIIYTPFIITFILIAIYFLNKKYANEIKLIFKKSD